MEEFEKWLKANEHLLPEETANLFWDSVKCCKFDIDRQAYLLAYQGMMKYVSNVITTCNNAPNGFSSGEWSDIQKKVNDEKDWDFNTYDRIYQQANGTKAAIINIPDEVRRKFPFWRDLRNVCAHYKSYRFIKAHTLALYSFISQYLLQMTVEGSMTTLVAEFDDYYNPSLTAPGSPTDGLISKIPKMVRQEELLAFYDAVQKVIHKRKVSRGFADFMYQVYKHSDESIKKSVTSYINSNNRDVFINMFPDSVLFLLQSEQDIRSFWHDELPYIPNRAKVLALLLTSEKITEPLEAIEHIQKEMYDRHHSIWGLDKDDVAVLRRFDYFNIFLKNYFDVKFTGAISNMSKICNRIDFYMSHLQYVEINTEFVKRIIDVFGTQFPYTLSSSFMAEFMGIKEKREAVERIASDNGWTIPENIMPKGV